MRVEKRNAANGNTYYNYCFSVKKCKACPMRETCKVGKSKCHTYSVTCVNDAHKARLEFESSEEFSNKMRIRHRIEPKFPPELSYTFVCIKSHKGVDFALGFGRRV